MEERRRAGLTGTDSEVFAPSATLHMYEPRMVCFLLGRAHSLSLGQRLRSSFGIDSVQQTSRRMVSKACEFSSGIQDAMQRNGGLSRQEFVGSKKKLNENQPEGQRGSFRSQLLDGSHFCHWLVVLSCSRFILSNSCFPTGGKDQTCWAIKSIQRRQYVGRLST